MLLKTPTERQTDVDANQEKVVKVVDAFTMFLVPVTHSTITALHEIGTDIGHKFFTGEY